MSKVKRRTFAEGKDLAARFERSGLSQVKFAQKLGLSVAVIRYWILKFRNEKKKRSLATKVRFLEVIPKAQPVEKQFGLVELPGGIVLKTLELPSPEYLGELCAEIQRWQSC